MRRLDIFRCARLSTLLFAALLSTFAQTAAAQTQREQSKDLGFGFREVHRLQASTQPDTPPQTQVLLYYKNAKIAQIAAYSISSNGIYALYQDATSSDIALFNSLTRQQRTVVQAPGALAVGFNWNEERRAATVSFENGRTARVVLK